MRIRGQMLKSLRLSRHVVPYLFIIISCLVGVAQAEAEILVSDDFENAATSNIMWTFKDAANFGVVLDPSKALFGNGVFQMIYRPNTPGPGFEHGKLSRAVPEVYIRWYEKYSANWKWSGNGQKIIFVNRGAVSIPEGLMLATRWGGNKPTLDFAGFWPAEIPQGNFVEQNVGGPVGYVPDKWHCLEFYVKAGQGGRAMLWFDGTLKMDYTASMPFAVIDGITLSGYYNETVSGDPSTGVPQLQYRWMDGLVVSTARVGCLPDTGDKNPPSAPKGLQVTSP